VATANAPAHPLASSRGSTSSAASQTATMKLVSDAQQKKVVPLSTWGLLLGIPLSIVMFLLGTLNWVGVLNWTFVNGEPTGLNVFLDFMVLGLVAFFAPYGFLKSREDARVDAIEARLPDFLRDVSEAGRFGMTLPDAIISASTGHYGILTEEIRRMASQLEWGVPVAQALLLFEERVPTPLVQRMVSIVIRANEAGGNVADVLTMVATNAREEQLSIISRQQTLITYLIVIYISFGVFLFTILILAGDFLPAMISAGQSVATSSSLAGGASAVPLQFALVPELYLAFLVAVIAHAAGDGIMAGVLHNGRISNGFRHASILLLVGWILMRFVLPPVVIPPTP
jgi:flagellar protein FlaJ